MRLFAATAIDDVTIADIAAKVGMTPAAVYYHFASKEQILLEGMRGFGDDLLAHTRSRRRPALVPGVGSADAVQLVLADIVAFVAERRPASAVYFVSSNGLNPMVEALRREIRHELVDEFRHAVRASRGPLALADAGVIAVGLVSLLETTAASMLTRDRSYRALGPRRFMVEVGAIAARIAGANRES